MRTRQITGALRTTLPDEVVDKLRTVALRTGQVTAGARMTPSFVVVGAQRCGTTSLFRLLSQHPHLVRPTISKGTGYFDDDYGRGWRWYQAHFPLRAMPGLASRSMHTFECSGYYLFHPQAAARIARDLPDAHAVVMVRDPVERAWSAYRHEVARGFESLSFEEALAHEGARTHHEASRLRLTPAYKSFEHRHHSYLQRGEYAPQIRRFIDALGPDRVHIVDAGRFFAHQAHEFATLQRSLGLPVWLPDSPEHSNARPGDPLAAQLRTRLMRHFEPFDEELATMLGHVPSWRKVVTP